MGRLPQSPSFHVLHAHLQVHIFCPVRRLVSFLIRNQNPVTVTVVAGGSAGLAASALSEDFSDRGESEIS